MAAGAMIVSVLGGCQQLDMAALRNLETGDIGPVAEDAGPLSAAVVDALAAAPMTMNERIRVRQVSDGHVRLVGFVSSDGVASEARRLTEQVAGVTGVVDTLNAR